MVTVEEFHRDAGEIQHEFTSNEYIQRISFD